MDDILAYEFCLKERIPKGVACTFYEANPNLDYDDKRVMKLVQVKKDYEQSLQNRRLLYEVAHNVNTICSMENYSNLYPRIVKILNKLKADESEIKPLKDAIAQLILITVVKKDLNISLYKNVIKSIYEPHHPKNKEYSSWIKKDSYAADIKEKYCDEEYYNELIDSIDSQISNLEVKLCGITMLEQLCIDKYVHNKGEKKSRKPVSVEEPLQQMREARLKLHEAQKDIQDPLEAISGINAPDSEEIESANSENPEEEVQKPVGERKNGIEPAVPMQPRKRSFWTKEEEERLIKGVHAYGDGNWHVICEKMHLQNRSNGDLKDKWRNIQKKQMTGVII